MDSMNILKIVTIACFATCFADDNTQVGITKVPLDGEKQSCQRYECNLGNLIVDAMIESNAQKKYGRTRWTDAAIAIHNSGSVKSSIERAVDDKITEGNIRAVLPDVRQIVRITVSGSEIREMLEHSVSNLVWRDPSITSTAFLHFSGLQVDYDLSKGKGSRVTSVLVRCADCRVPEFKKLDKYKDYEVLTTDFIAHGGDGFTMLQGKTQDRTGVTMFDAVVRYLSEHKPVHPGVEWRINFLNEKRLTNVTPSLSTTPRNVKPAELPTETKNTEPSERRTTPRNIKPAKLPTETNNTEPSERRTSLKNDASVELSIDPQNMVPSYQTVSESRKINNINRQANSSGRNLNGIISILILSIVLFLSI